MMGLVVWSNVKKFIEMNVGEDVAAALETKVEEALKKAEERARANGRRTVYARDL
jgi:histone H3/H4